MNNFAWAAKHFFRYLHGTSQAHLAVLKVFTNMDTTLENAYKLWSSKL